jgi:hypothetical protein
MVRNYYPLDIYKTNNFIKNEINNCFLNVEDIVQKLIYNGFCHPKMKEENIRGELCLNKVVDVTGLCKKHRPKKKIYCIYCKRKVKSIGSLYNYHMNEICNNVLPPITDEEKEFFGTSVYKCLFICKNIIIKELIKKYNFDDNSAIIIEYINYYMNFIFV